MSGGEGGEPLELGQGCVSTGPNPWEWGANQIYEPGFEPGIGGVTIHLGSGACPAIGLSSTITAGDGTYALSGLPPGDVLRFLRFPERRQRRSPDPRRA